MPVFWMRMPCGCDGWHISCVCAHKPSFDFAHTMHVERDVLETSERQTIFNSNDVRAKYHYFNLHMYLFSIGRIALYVYEYFDSGTATSCIAVGSMSSFSNSHSSVHKFNPFLMYEHPLFYHWVIEYYFYILHYFSDRDSYSLISPPER